MHPGFGATHRCCEGHSSPFPPEQENATLNVDSAIDTRQRHDRIAPRAAPSSTLPRNTARLLKPGIPAATGRNEIPAHIKADRPHHLTTTERLSPPPETASRPEWIAANCPASAWLSLTSTDRRAIWPPLTASPPLEGRSQSAQHRSIHAKLNLRH